MDRHLTTTLLLTAAILTIGNLAGLLIAPLSWQAGIISHLGLEIGWNLIAIIPAAIAGLVIFSRGHRSGYWFWILLPGVAIWVMRPWLSTETGAKFLWSHEYLRAYGKQVWPAVWHGQAMSPYAAAFFVGAFLMFLLTAMMTGPTVKQFRKDMRHLRRGGSGGRIGKDGLPQASFASARQVRGNFDNPGGIVLGELTDPLRDTPNFMPGKPRIWKRQGRGRLITMNPADGNGHVLVLAASAGYKTSGLVIPNILHYDDPIVVFDPKGDLYQRTKGAREKMGYDAVVINAGTGFDPFKMIAPLATQVPSVYHTMAKQLMPLSSRPSDISEYFHDMAVSLFAALTAHFVKENEDNIARAISVFINRPRKTVVLEAQDIARKSILPFVVDELAGLSALDERTWPGLVKGITNKLSFIQYPDIANYARSTLSPDKHLAALSPKTDIFISIPSLAAQHFSPFPRLLIGAMFVASELLEQPDRPRARRLFLIDEARVLGGMDVLNNVRDAGRSIGMHLMLIYQSLGQVQEAWGNAGADAWLDSCEARVISAVGSSRTAADICAMLGQRNIRITTEGTSSQHQVMAPMGGSVSSSESEQLREVPLMAQAALGQLPGHGAIIFNRRIPPILGTKALYFTRLDMRDRVKTPESVSAELDVTRRREAVLQGIQDRKGPKTGGEDTRRGDPTGTHMKGPKQHNNPPVAMLHDKGPAAADKNSADETQRRTQPQDNEGEAAEDGNAPHAHPDMAQTAEPDPPASPPADSPDAADPAQPSEPAADKDLAYAWQPERVTAFLLPVWTVWARYMVPRPDTPLNIRHDTGDIIPHPKDVRDGPWIVRLWDRIDWCFSHPDGRYELYDLKRRRRQWDGLEWRLHLLKCWIRNEPRGKPPGMRPSTDPPDHATLRARISPATKDLDPTDKRYDPLANAIHIPHTDPSQAGKPPPSAEWTSCDVGPLPPGQPTQLVFEHVLNADDPAGHPDHVTFNRYLRTRITQDVLVEALLRDRKPLNSADMLFFDQWPEIPRQHAAHSAMPVSDRCTPLHAWNAVLWTDRIVDPAAGTDEWRIFRQAVHGPTGTPLGAARTWPIMGHNLDWLDKPIVCRSIHDHQWVD